MERVTVEDIAKKVGVTKGLVSRALTGKYNVSDEMRATITRTAVEMGYDFDKLRTKSKKRSKCMLIMSSHMLSSEDYWQPIIKGITTTLDEAKIDLDYYIYDEDKLSEEDADKVKSTNVSGYILMHNNPEMLMKSVEITNRPVIVVDPKRVRTGNHLQIKFSNFDSIYELTQRLINGGHRHIVFYGAKNWSQSFDERRNGFENCIRDNSELGVKKYNVVFDNSQGYYEEKERFEQVLKDNPQITAVVCVNDIVAFNAIRSIKRLGKSVPGDYSIIGFDDIPESKPENMDLTTVNVPRTALGVETAKYLINHISNKQIQYSQIIIGCKTIIRGSIKDINTNLGD